MIDALRRAGCVFAEDEARVLADAAGSPATVRAFLDRRIAGEPLEHIVGWVEFDGLRIRVGPGVFVPRRRTEMLVSVAVAHLAPASVFVEMCCGSAAVTRAVMERTGIRAVTASDIDPVAVEYASTNAPDAHIVCGDLFDPLPGDLVGRVDVIVANAPYVPGHAIAFMPRDARDHEPRQALDGGDDGLAIARRIVADAPRWLADGGTLAIETSPAQAPHLAAAFERAGLTAATVTDDDIDGCAVVGTRLPVGSPRPAGRSDVHP
ncbi:putative protein N(5)-glutamine methyltransferase [Williamsia sp. MIQD14]|uniref:putative protein N(5)-glutamine methyltransferase n=1 Tax=Williamsia sp. MIQD14 TaxID=3425703 RepID=UPI003DA06A73